MSATPALSSQSLDESARDDVGRDKHTAIEGVNASRIKTFAEAPKMIPRYWLTQEYRVHLESAQVKGAEGRIRCHSAFIHGLCLLSPRT